MKINYIIILLCFIAFTTMVKGQCVWKGKVIDFQTGEPLSGVTLSVDGQAVGITELDGSYRITLPCSDSILLFSYVGYRNVALPISEEEEVVRLAATSAVLDQLVVSANRYEQKRNTVPVSISALSTQLLDETRPQRLDEMLNKVPGVYMVDLGSEQHTMAIRQPINYKGLFLYLEDGIPIRPTGVFNHNALLEMNMAALSRIEVIRGPASSLYGSEAIGGAINFITLRPSAIPTAWVRVQGNLRGYLRADLQASNTFGKLGVGVYGYYAERVDGIRQHTDFDKLALSLQANYMISNRSALRFDISTIDYYADMTGSMDSTFFYGKDYSSQHTFTYREVKALRSKLNYQFQWNDQAMTRVTLLARDNVIRQNPAYRVQDDFSPWARPWGDKYLAHGEVNEDRVYSFGLVGQHNHSFTWWNGSRFTAGFYLDRSPDRFFANYISIEKNEEGAYVGFTASDSVLTDYEVMLFNAGFYGNWSIDLTEDIQFSAALRYDHLNYDFKNNLNENAFSGAPDDVDRFSAWTPRLGINWAVNAESGLYANYSQGFLPPQITELYRGVRIPVLQPSIYRNYEMGGYFQWGFGLGVDFSVYQLNGNNEVITVLLDDGSEENRNAGQTTHRGIEYGLNWQIGEDLHMRWSGTYAIHKFGQYEELGNDYSGNEMGQAPSWIANAELIYKPGFVPGLRISLEGHYVAKYYMDHANTGEYPGYQIWNGRLAYAKGNMEVWLHAMNFTNALFATVVRRSAWGDSYHAGEPRTITLGVGYKFEHKNQE